MADKWLLKKRDSLGVSLEPQWDSGFPLQVSCCLCCNNGS